jgi:hypothetical protein
MPFFTNFLVRLQLPQRPLAKPFGAASGPPTSLHSLATVFSALPDWILIKPWFELID